MWGEQVTVVSCDMREWKAPEKTDILVSELLGSFGDNELSPECLDGAQRFLKGETENKQTEIRVCCLQFCPALHHLGHLCNMLVSSS